MICSKCKKEHEADALCRLINLTRAGVTMDLADVPLVFFDVETTGLHPHRSDRIVEISLLKVLGGEIVETFETLVDPQRQIPSAATAVNGIDMWKVMGKPPFADILDEIRRVMTDQCVVVGHNIDFDLRFLNWETARAGRAREQWMGLSFCTLLLSRKLYKFENNKLGHVAQKLGVAVPEAHRAGADVATTVGVFDVMCERIRPKETALTVKHVLQAQGGYVPSPLAGAPAPLPQRGTGGRFS